MTRGFGDPVRVARLRAELTQWTLYQVTVDLYYVEFWFQHGHALANMAYRFETKSPDGKDYIYDIQAAGDRKTLNVDFLLRKKVLSVEAAGHRELRLEFEGGGWLTMHDSPTMRSAWFYRYNGENHLITEWAEEDDEHDSEW